MKKVRAHLWISGLVQGVFFRAYTEEEAHRLGLTGWVKNIPGDRVEAIFEGDEPKVREVIKWCHHGPPSAEVTKVEVKWEEPTEEYNDFLIKY